VTACWLCNFGRNTGDGSPTVLAIVTLTPLNEAPS
jgi:hypothetical protein